MDRIGVLSPLYQVKPVTTNMDVACFKECLLERQERERMKVTRAPACLNPWCPEQTDRAIASD
jgi:hypothetical protein